MPEIPGPVAFFALKKWFQMKNMEAIELGDWLEVVCDFNERKAGCVVSKIAVDVGFEGLRRDVL